MNNEENQQVRDIMTPDPSVVFEKTLISDAARIMRDTNVGSLVVVDGEGNVVGMITDRDLVIRGIARGTDMQRAQVGELYSRDPIFLSPQDSVSDAVRVMTSASVRRVPVVEHGLPVGVVSLGDLAGARAPHSALGYISQAPAQT